MPFWKRKKQDAFEAWQSETKTEVVTTTGDVPTSFGSDPSSSSVTKVVVNSEDFDPSNAQHREAIETAEAMSGMDLDGDGKVAERPAHAPAFGVGGVFGKAFGQPAAAPDPISQLERLQRLRESGTLTEAEFEEQKRRILGSD